MSKYEDYNTTSRSYDKQRQTMGSDVMAALIQFHCGKPMTDIHVLDAGCGTGNYTKDFIKYGIGHMTLLDASSGMLEEAKSKLSDHIASGKIKDVIEAELPSLPFPERTFDAVLFSLVLHHLESQDGDGGFKNTTDALKEAKRVLKPNGVIIICTGFPHIFTNSVWFTQIHTAITDRYIKKFPNPDDWETIFVSAELKCVQKMNLLDCNVLDYYNFEGPLDDEWRSANSYWALGTPDELEEVKSFVRKLKSMGELVNWCKAHDHIKSSGFLTVFALTQGN